MLDVPTWSGDVPTWSGGTPKCPELLLGLHRLTGWLGRWNMLDRSEGTLPEHKLSKEML